MDGEREQSSGSTVGAEELLAPLLDIARSLSALPSMASRGDRDGWVEVVRSCQSIVNAATAVQDEAMVRLVAIEPVVLEDGTVAESHRTPGHVALDGPALVASALEVSQVHAERRVRAAVGLAADGPAGTTTCTGLGALHDAMRSGRLDGYRAGVIAHELEEAPPEVAETVVASLGDHLGRETAPQLRRRCRRLLARISPDLLRQRATRARQECSLRRWVGEPGVDRWEASFPSEDAARAWAAIDARARDLVADGTCERVDRARAQALIDLVMQSSTVTTIVTLTVPAARADSTRTRDASTGMVGDLTHGGATRPRRAAAHLVRADDAFVEVATGRSVEPVLVSTTWLGALLADSRPGRGAEVRLRLRECDPATGALLDSTTSDAYRPPGALARLVRQRDGRCRFPGCSVAARFCDLDHVRPWPAGPTAADNLICLCRRHHRVKQRPGWTVRLTPDGVVTWTEPTGRLRTTLPVDALHTVRLPAAAVPPPAAGPSPATPLVTTTALANPNGRPLRLSGDAFSHLEFGLEHAIGDSLPARSTRCRPGLDLHPVAGYAVETAPRTGGCRAHRRSRTRHRPQDPPDLPPF